ncbi:MAG: tryptophan synthase subunit alpha [Puniceicoccales bacterium]|nr:tryptophan synthase subunit alpha [Puniceicoccales bacterium]
MDSFDRIASAFQNARRQGRAAFIAYVCGGDPDFETSAALMESLLNTGVDILEIGVPFSDPLADGRTNQLASQRALESGMTSENLLSLVRLTREKFPNVPFILYIYYNLILSQGTAAFLRACKNAGVDGILALDCPPEEAGELLAASRENGLANIFIVAPTTPPDRIVRITSEASGFIYYVSREGVTGEHKDLAQNIGSAVARIKHYTALPVAVGFGISSPEQVAAVGRVANGVVVGSALVNVIAANLHDRTKIPAALATKTAALLSGLRKSPQT